MQRMVPLTMMPMRSPLPRPNFPLRFADAPRDGKNPCGMWGSHRKHFCQRTYRDVLEEWREIYGWVPASSRSRLKRYYLGGAE